MNNVECDWCGDDIEINELVLGDDQFETPYCSDKCKEEAEIENDRRIQEAKRLHGQV